MIRSQQQLRDDALAIWKAGVSAVDSEQLVRQAVLVEKGQLRVGDDSFSTEEIDRIVVVGAGKAGAGMARGLLQGLGSKLATATQLTGWVNVPADCVQELPRITLHAARAASDNSPTHAGVRGTEQILKLIRSLGARDICFCLLSGGGSALLPAPVSGVTLEDKQAVTSQLSSAGANIHQLNTVRKQLSQVKGGGLARACRAGRLVTLIISDVIGDQLDIIASGPTVPDPATPAEALQVLEQFQARRAGIHPRVFEVLAHMTPSPQTESFQHVSNLLIGNNALAVDAAGVEAERRGYSHAMISAQQPESRAEEVGMRLAAMALQMRAEHGPDCLISGGEPIVELVAADKRGTGGRNQQLVLAALLRLLESEAESDSPLHGIVLLSGGTDGEDGPTDAAGAWVDAATVEKMRAMQLMPQSFLDRNNAYPFFEPLGALIKTGPTHTNVCDIRVITVSRRS